MRRESRGEAIEEFNCEFASSQTLSATREEQEAVSIASIETVPFTFTCCLELKSTIYAALRNERKVGLLVCLYCLSPIGHLHA